HSHDRISRGRVGDGCPAQTTHTLAPARQGGGNPQRRVRGTPLVRDVASLDGVAVWVNTAGDECRGLSCLSAGFMRCLATARAATFTTCSSAETSTSNGGGCSACWASLFGRVTWRSPSARTVVF